MQKALQFTRPPPSTDDAYPLATWTTAGWTAQLQICDLAVTRLPYVIKPQSYRRLGAGPLSSEVPLLDEAVEYLAP